MAFFETALGGAALEVGVGLVKGIFAGRSAKKQRAQALQDQALQFVRLRDAAEAGGFNPLTVLRSNPGGGMVNPTPALASGEFVADALGSGVQTYFNRKQEIRDEERDMLEKALMREELNQMQKQGRSVTAANMGFGFSIPTSNNYTGTTARTQSRFPGVLPGSPDGPKIWVHKPDGTRAYLLKSAMDSIGVAAGEYITAGQWQELVGEGAGEVEIALVNDKVRRAVGLSFFGNDNSARPQKVKPAMAPNRADVWRNQ